MKEMVSEILEFMFSKKSRVVLIPFVIVLLIFSLLFLCVGGSSWAPFVYAIF